MSSEHEKHMREAIRLSAEGMRKGDGGPFGAVIVKEGKVIGRGWNKVIANSDPTAHAEVEAIREACRGLKDFDLHGAVIYTSCEPCPMCLAAIYWAHLDHIYYANDRTDAAKIAFDDDFIYGEIAKPLQDRKIPMQACLRNEALPIFLEWSAKADKTPY